MKLANLIALALLMLPLTSHATGPLMGREVNNGGDPVAIDFHTRALEAIAVVKGDPAKYPELTGIDLAAILDSSELIVTEYALPVTINGTIQLSTARNVRNPNRIEIYRKGWNDTYEPFLQQALALHEVLCLAGLEQSGVYTITQRYKNRQPKPRFYASHSSFWTFRRPSEDEQHQFSSIWPEIANLSQPTHVDEISQYLKMPIRDLTDSYQLKEMTVVVLHYALSETTGARRDIYQVVMFDVNNRFYRTNVYRESPDFHLFAVSVRAGTEDIVLSSIEKDPRTGKPAMHITSVNNPHSDYYQAFGFDSMDDLKDWTNLDDYSEYIVIGRPSKERKFGLYRTGTYENSLIMPLPDSWPMPNDNVPREKRWVAKRILGTFKNDRGTFVLVNDLAGILSVNIETGESKNIYEVSEDGHFAAVAGSANYNIDINCVEVPVEIYAQDQGAAFYSDIVHGADAGLVEAYRPKYTLNMGIFADSRFFKTGTRGCQLRDP